MDYGFAPRLFGTPLKRLLLIALLVANAIVWYSWVQAERWLPLKLRPALEVTFLNVGQGDAILIRTPRGRTFLVDGGDGGSKEQAVQAGHLTILDHLARRGIERLDGIVVTHFHNDHLGGVVKVLNECSVERVWDAGGMTSAAAFQKYEETLKRSRVPRLRVRAGDRLDWGADLDVRVLHPEPEVPGSEPGDQNSRSVVLLIRYGKSALLLPGDVEKDEQRELARYGGGIRAQVLKVPHHGSADGLFLPFLEKVAPGDAIVSVGRENPFGYPASATLQAHRQRGTRLWRTDEQGSVKCLLDGGDATESKVEVDRSL